ncbi:hypothetical protein D3C79_713490 [compost metagenome]
MAEHAGQHVGQHHAAGHTRRSLQSTAEEPAGPRRRSRLLWRLLRLLLRGITRLRLIVPGGIILLLRLVLVARAWRIAIAAAEQPGQETAAALLAGGILLLLGNLVLQIFYPLVQLLQRRFLNDHRLRHVIRCRRLFTDMLVDELLCLEIPLARLGLGFFQAAKQTIDKALFFRLHRVTSGDK